MNGCISINLEVVPTDSPQLTPYSGLCLRTRSQYGDVSLIGEWFGVSCALIPTLYSVGCTDKLKTRDYPVYHITLHFGMDVNVTSESYL